MAWFANDTAEIDLKVFDEECRPTISEKGDWIDLRSMEEVHMSKGEYREIPLGVAMKLPSGFEAYIAPRSSTFKKYGLTETNSFGVIDNSYCGPNDMWKLPVLAHRDNVIIHKGERICQFRIQAKMPTVRFADSTLETEKDRGGFGSTGTK